MKRRKFYFDLSNREQRGVFSINMLLSSCEASDTSHDHHGIGGMKINKGLAIIVEEKPFSQYYKPFCNHLDTIK